MLKGLRGISLVALLGIGLSALTAGIASAQFVQQNLVSNIPGLAALTDPNLANPWGMSFSATSPFWVSDQGKNLATLYRINAGVITKVGLEVAIPTT
ncbi:MAG TPA: TIGR03118 family protein, partial [Casimicrobiaceae bacterium]